MSTETLTPLLRKAVHELLHGGDERIAGVMPTDDGPESLHEGSPVLVIVAGIPRGQAGELEEAHRGDVGLRIELGASHT